MERFEPFQGLKFVNGCVVHLNVFTYFRRFNHQVNVAFLFQWSPLHILGLLAHALGLSQICLVANVGHLVDESQ